MCAFPATQPAIFAGQTITGAGADTALISSAYVVRKPTSGQQEALDGALEAISDARRAEITPVPGRTGSDVLGAFWFRNSAYAVRDLPRIRFEGGYYLPQSEGAFITLGEGEGATQHQILDVAVTGDRSGVIVYDPIPGLGPVPSVIGTPTLTELPVSGDFGAATATVPYSDGLVVSGGISPYSWILVEDDTGPAEPAEIGDFSEIQFMSEQTEAMLWQATSSGWQMAFSNREVAFSGGREPLKNPTRSLALDPGDPITTARVFPTDSDVDGATTTAVNADDGTTLALNGLSGQTVVCAGFGLSSIPADAQILGIEVDIERTSSGASVADGFVQLVGLPTPSSNKARGAWAAGPAVATYGGPSDRWGFEVLSPAMLSPAMLGDFNQGGDDRNECSDDE
jgi:hypothetical protein